MLKNRNTAKKISTGNIIDSFMVFFSLFYNY